MKFAKKVMALALAAVLTVGGAVGVSAAGSRTNEITVSSEQSQIYEVVKKIEETEGFKTLETKAPEVADVFKQVNEGKKEMSDFKDTLTKLAETADDTLKAAIEEVVEKLEGKDFVTGFDQFNVLDKEKAVPNEDGKYEVELSVPNMTDDMENIQLVCYNAETGEWTIIDPISIDKENKTIKVALEDHCYFSIISDEVKTAE